MQVPCKWQRACASLNGLEAWVCDLRERLAQLTAWAAAGPPAVFWLAGFSRPSALLSAVLLVSPGT